MNDMTSPVIHPRLRLFSAPLLALVVFALVFSLFFPSVRYDFVDFDDTSYVIGNKLVHPGLALASVRDAFAAPPDFAAMYMPLLWISYMADVSFFGASIGNPAPFHAVNVALHAANAALFFFLLRRLFRLLFPSGSMRSENLSAFALALLWAVHPLRVESVAWIAERKDVLSLFFALLSLFAYLPLRPSGNPGCAGVPEANPPSGGGHLLLHALSFSFFLLALLSKPTLVPFPLLLVLVDVLVLRHPLSFRLFLAKTPFFLLSGAAALATLAGHAPTVVPLPLATRVFHVPQILAHYVQVVLLPFRLTLFAPRPAYAFLPAILDVVLLLLLVLGAIRLRRRAPLSSLGLLWFFLFLLPVSGLAAIPNNDVADRFTYVPALGLSVALLPLFAPAARPFVRRMAFAVAIPLAALLAFLSSALLPVWRSTDALCGRIRRFSPHNPLVAVYDIEKAIQVSGDFSSARRIACEALEQTPDSMQLKERLATCISNLDGPLPAMEYLLSRRPAPGIFLGTWAWHMAHLSLRVSLPLDALAYADLAAANIPPQDTRHANIQRLRAAASSPDPADALPHAISQWMLYERADALETFRRLVAAYPSRPDVLANVAWILATAAWSPAPPSEPLAYVTDAIAAAENHVPPELFDTCAAALANASDFPAAVAAQERAISLLPPSSPSLPAYQSRLSLYRQSIPFRQDTGISW